MNRWIFALVAISMASLYAETTTVTKTTSKEVKPLFTVGPVTLEISDSTMNIKVISEWTRQRRNVLTGAETLWTDGKVPFKFDSSMPAFSKIEIMAAMQEIEMSTYSGGHPCILFVPRSTEEDYIRISHTGSSHGTTSIGRIGGEQDLTVNTAEVRGHDDNLFSLMAVLGMIPEVMRTDRDTYLDLNLNNSISTQPFRILTGEGTSTFDQPFDFESLLLDSPYTYSYDPSEPVVMAKVDGKVMGQSVSLSTGDATLLQNAYQCEVDASNVIDILGKMPIVCYFHENTCNLTQSAGNDFDWVVQAGPTATPVTGPKADHSSGSGKFAVAIAAGHNNQVSRMVSPMIPAGEYCMRTQLHMFGRDVGQLRISMVHTTGNDTDIVTQTGSMYYNAWYHMYFTLQAVDSFVIQFEATIGDGDEGDIAVDDVLLYSGQCIEWD